MLRLGDDHDFDALYSIYMEPTVNPYLSFEIMTKELFRSIFHEMIQKGTLYVYQDADGQPMTTCIVQRLIRRCVHVVRLTTLAANPLF
jgi:hypothetical protein